MAQTKAGAAKARATLLEKDPDYFAKIGSLGGKASGTGGFYWMKVNGHMEKIQAAGSKGGSKSRPRKYEN